MHADAGVSSSEEGSSLDEPTWVSWFCMLRNHEDFCEGDPAFIQDRPNLYGLKEIIGPLYGESMTMILGYAPTEKQLGDPSTRVHKVLETACTLYGLIHARYILSAQGLSDMVSPRRPAPRASPRTPRTLPTAPARRNSASSSQVDDHARAICRRSCASDESKIMRER